MKIRGIVVTVIFFLLLTMVSFGKNESNTIAFDTTKFMGVEEIKPGMKAIGKTVFSGTKVENFDVKIIGVLKNAFPKGDMILAELYSDKLTDIGVVAGMSGSPVYINNRLIGAVAYGWTFSKKPIAGITPIKSMLKVFDQSGETFHSSYSKKNFMSSDNLPDNKSLHSLTINKSKLETNGDSEAEALPNSFSMEPLSTPLFVSHCSPALFPALKEYFKDYNLTPVVTGGGQSAEDGTKIPPLEGGSALGVQLLKGDLEMSGIGTVTYVDDKRLVAFGHPMFADGTVEFPMSNAVIHTIMPSIFHPFKLGSAVDTIGTINEDRLPAIGGVIGKVPDMIPITVTIDDSQTKSQSTFNYEAIRHRKFTPFMATMALLESINGAARTGGDFTAIVNYNIKLKGLPPIDKTQIVSNESDLPTIVSLPFANDLDCLANNEFKPIDIEKINVNVKIMDELKIAEITAVKLNKNKYKPGDEVTATLYLQTFREGVEKVKVPLKIPGDIPLGTYQLVISDAKTKKGNDNRRAPGLTEPTNLQQLVGVMNKEYLMNRLYAELVDSNNGMVIKGEEVPSLPPSVYSAMSSNNLEGFSSPTFGKIISANTIDTDKSVSGCFSTAIEVTDK